MARRHLAIFVKGVAEKILTSQKEVEVRLSRNKVLPYEQIQKDDEIYLKDAGKKIIGRAFVDNCLFYDNLNPDMLANIRREYQEASQMGDDFWQKKENSRYATIIFLRNPQRFLAPVFYKKNDRRPWLIMEE